MTTRDVAGQHSLFTMHDTFLSPWRREDCGFPPESSAHRKRRTAGLDDYEAPEPPPPLPRGEPLSVALIGCGSRKLDHAAPARDLYTGALFRKALRYAEQNFDRVYVVSARHGLLELDTVIEPYDHRMPHRRDDESALWGTAVASALGSVTQGPERHALEVSLLAGRDYAYWIESALNCFDEVLVDTPLEGLQVGERLRWFNEHTKGTP